MPFAPSILSEEEDYIVNPKKIKSQYMAIGFDSTELGKVTYTCRLASV